MDRYCHVNFEDACVNFARLLDNEFAGFCSPLIIKRRIQDLLTTVDLITQNAHMNGTALEDHVIQVNHALLDLLQHIPYESHSSFNPKKIMLHRRVRRKMTEIQAMIISHLAEAKSISVTQVKPIERDHYDYDDDDDDDAAAADVKYVHSHRHVFEWRRDVYRIVSFLVSQASASHLPFIFSIIGRGGIGKTTVARIVYNNRKVRSHFDERIWVSVSHNFSIKKILCSIIESVAREKYNVYDLDVIERKVREVLQFKRYLLVLDNVGEDVKESDKLKHVLKCGSKGACILVTTRYESVAEIMETKEAYFLEKLTDMACSCLFVQYAFGPQDTMPDEFVQMSKIIGHMCRGLPLEARALGSLMRSKGIEGDKWREVLINWSSYSSDVIIEDYGVTSLRMSYSDLTRSSRQCFAFCAIFPLYTEIIKEALIHLWMANGFISPEENMEVEQVGDIIWNELHEKSFFTDIKIDDYSGDVSFKMPDLVHDFACSVGQQECVILDNVNMNQLPRSTLHVGFGSDLLSFNKEAFQKVEFLQMLYQFEFAFYNTVSGSFPTNHSLRVLSTSYFKLSSLGNLVHLRYLELYGFEIKSLPNSIYSLQKLETLKLTSCGKLVCLPKHLTRLQNLRHLIITGCHSLSLMCPNTHKLSCLRTLSLFIVSSKKGHKLEEIGGLNLGGKLCIEGLQYVESLSKAEGANLMGKTSLHELCLSWDNTVESKSNANEVLEALQPPPHLKTLRIYDYEGSYLPSWIQNLESLIVLELFDCKKCLQLPQLSKLPTLRKLEIFSMDDVRYMDDDESWDDVKVSFPSFVQLEVRGLPNLQKLLKVEREDMFPILSKVTIDDCSGLQLTSLPSIEQLNIRGCYYSLLWSISNFNGLTFLNLSRGEYLISFPEGMMRNLTSLRTMILYDFLKLNVLPDELLNLNALELLKVEREDMFPILSKVTIDDCSGLQLTSLPSIEQLNIRGCYYSLVWSISNFSGFTFFNLSRGEYLIFCLEGMMINLTSLRTMILYDFLKLNVLPDELKSLP